MRRLRTSGWMRSLVGECSLTPSDLIWPMFVIPDDLPSQPIASMQGVRREPISQIVRMAEEAVKLGIPAIALFPVTPDSKKTDEGLESLNSNNLICAATRAIRQVVGDKLGIVCDVALDPYTTHGHDGLLHEGRVVNDLTVEVLCKQAVVQAAAGCDIIAPSDMMDGRIGAIRAALDANSFHDVAIMSYAAKFASAFYGPFRDAVGSAKSLKSGDKKSYQMDPSCHEQALHEVALDLQEGADIIMVKPGMPYLDIIRSVSQTFQVSVTAYQVSGEYAMIKSASQQGYLNERDCVLESLLAFKRAGACGVLTYYARQAAEWMA